MDSKEVTLEELAEKVGKFIEYDAVSGKYSEERVRALIKKFQTLMPSWVVGYAKGSGHPHPRVRKQIVEFIDAYNAPVLGED